VDVFPYAARAGQAELVTRLAAAVQQGAHVVAESGTGTGKTVCALAAALPAALSAGKRVLYLTRTNAQERQVMIELRRILPRLPMPASGVALQGRRSLCPLVREDPTFAEANAEELAVLCRDRVRAAKDAADGKRSKFAPCAHFQRTAGDPLDRLATRLRAEPEPAEDLARLAMAEGMCPYYVSRELLKDATLVVAPYVWFFHPQLRRALLEWMGAGVADLVVVVDEAHNLPDYARDLGSSRLGRGTLERAAREVEEFGDRELPTATGLALSAFLARLVGVLEDLAARYLDEDDGLVPPDAFDEELLVALRSTTRTWDRVAAMLLGYGEEVREARRCSGRVPRSYVGAVGSFLVAYREADPVSHLRLIEDPADPCLALACLDASVATAPLLDAHATVHLSGTLVPLEAYRDEIGLPPETDLVCIPSPFSPDRRVVLVDPTVTTRHAEVARDPSAWDRLGRRIAELRAATAGRNMAVFVPSYDVLKRLRRYVPEGSLVEEAGARQGDLMAAVTRFRSARGATLLAVVGGRLAEGLDFPGGELEVVVVAGLPYPKPTARLHGLVHFLDARHGRGFEYAVTAPTVRRTLQAVGRLLRGPEDRGVVALLDRRATLLGPHLPGLATDASLPESARAFFAAKH